MLRRPKVTVTMPAYNASKFIVEAIESVLAQDYDDYEILIIDDGSTDDTLEIIRSYAAHPRVRWLAQPHRGIGPTRNHLVRLAYGKYISICDDDDRLLPNKLKRHAAILDRHPRVAVVYGDIQVMNKDGKLIDYRGPLSRDMNAGWDLLDNVVMHCGATIRRSAILSVGGYLETATSVEDYDLWLKLAEVAPFKYVNECCAVYRMYEESASSRDPRKREHLIQVKKEAILRRYGRSLAGQFRW